MPFEIIFDGKREPTACPAEQEAVEWENRQPCGIRSPDDGAWGKWRCSRKPGHEGAHVAAYGLDSSESDRWPNGAILMRWIETE